MRSQTFSIVVWGKYACFTEPGFTAQAVSYPMMTPSAAKGILDSVLMKKIDNNEKAFNWVIEAISVLVPPDRDPETYTYGEFRNSTINIFKDKIALDRVAGYLNSGLSPASLATNRTQKTHIDLRDVCYRIDCYMEFHTSVKPGMDNNPQKYVEMFKRRVITCDPYYLPFLGRRELPVSGLCFFDESKHKIYDVNMDLKLFFHSFDYDNGKKPRFFKAMVKNGKMECV